ncbi:CRISPR-associated helicase/endonuclease Cas3 [Cellulomonas bogoriensis]|uniref:CRISPR-associated protein Cas3 n=1 Tax=Cellulomonas bogoriensis 69B4 = DSM 16987 TaxID=1386082 RepID=A0A0A0C0D3_9CELL|nr:CRISPR-associated helicase/endonuclease Cas3 [Cellulomonas bogoriensis]KGM13640.1 CRISPR-associated protein Cas3 [Cellulomonas bogoriensis 69B4 = DSM 16987]
MTFGGEHTAGVPEAAPGAPPDALAVVWAKSWPQGQPPELWLPLWQHLDDTADAAGLLWDQWVPPAVRAVVGEALPDGEADGRRLVRWLAGVHDVGKATPAFVVQVDALANRVIRAGLAIGPMVRNDRAALRHEIAGAAIVDRWLAERVGLPRVARRQFTSVVAGHHGSFPLLSTVQDAPDRRHLIGDQAWEAVQAALLDRVAERTGAQERWPEWAAVKLPQPVQMLATGLVVMADWIASGEAFPLHPLASVPALPPASDHASLRAQMAWRDVDLGDRWRPHPVPTDPLDRFTDRFGWRPRPLQAAATELATTMEAPGLMVIEAPMGVGKTETGFMAAEALAARTGAAGCFVALPTQATSNAMFGRMLAWMSRLPDAAGAERQSVSLVHGKASLNQEYRSLRLGRTHAPVYDDPHAEGVPRLRATVHEWMSGRKKAALASFAVGTIDQVLFDALRARHIMLRQLSLAGKVVIIDEVHAADVYMSTFLDRALEWLAATGTSVVLLSATLPASRRRDLSLAYARGRAIAEGRTTSVDAEATAVLDGHIGYPAIVTSGYDRPLVHVVPDDGTTARVAVRRLDDDLPALIEMLTHQLADGGCAVVIRNTVRRAQETAAALAAVFGEDDVTVAHAQFLSVDRAANDAALLARFGPPDDAVARPSRHVVVGTQVVEQSLDVDFDLMVTDVAPVDLVLQRIGRLHRHRRGPGESQRPERVRTAACYITGVDWTGETPGLDRGAVAVYRRWPLLMALHVLQPHLDGADLELPTAISPLVQAAYGDLDTPLQWQEVVESARQDYADEQAERHERAKNFALPPVGPHGRDLYNLSHTGAGDLDEDSPAGQACVRDGGESLEVVVVQHGRDGVDRVPDWVDGGGEPLPLRHVELPWDHARLLAGCTLRLPRALTHPGVIEQVISDLERNWFEGWQRSPFLSGQLALVLDDDRRATLAGHDLHYDTRRGLVLGRTNGRQ